MLTKPLLISYCLGVYNEEKILLASLEKLKEGLSKILGRNNYEIIVVDNGSTDRTWDLLRSLKDKSIRTFRIEEKGLGLAFKTAFEKARFNSVFLGAIDLPFGLEDLAESLKLAYDHDLIFGSKSHPQSKVLVSVKRKFSSFVYQTILKILFGLKVKDSQGTILLDKKGCLPIINLCDAKNAFFTSQLAIYGQLFGLRIKEIPVKMFPQEIFRKSKFSILKDGWKMLLTSLSEYSRFKKLTSGMLVQKEGVKPLHKCVGAGFLLAGAALAVFSLRSYFLRPGISFFGELTVLSDFSWMIDQLSYAWNTYYVLGHPQISYPLAPGASPLVQTTNPVTSLIDIYFLKTLSILFGNWWQFTSFFLAVYLNFLFMFIFMNYHLGKNYKSLTYIQTKFLSFVAGAFFMINPITVDRFGAGGIRYSLSQSIIPLAVFLYFFMKDNLGFNRKYIRALIIFILVLFYQVMMFPHFTVMFVIFVTLDILLSPQSFRQFKANIVNYLAMFGLSGISLLILSAYFLVPPLFYKEIFTSNAEGGFFSLTTVQGLGIKATLENVIRLLPIITENNSQISLYIFPFLVLFSLLIINRRKKIYFGIYFILFVFLAKGLNRPFSELSIFLYKNLPLLHAFRDPTKFVTFLAFLYAWLIPFGVVNLKRFLYVFGIVVFGLIIYLNPKFLTGNFEGFVNKITIPSEYYEAQKYINSEAKGKVLYLPYESALGHLTWYGKPSVPSNHFTPFHIYLPLNVPIANAFSNDYSNTYSQRFMKYVQTIKDPHFLSLMASKIGIEYLIFDKNIRETYQSANYEFADFKKMRESLNTSLDFEHSKTFGNLDLFRVKNFDNAFFSGANKPLYVVGDLNIYSSLYEVNPNLPQNPVIFLNQEGVLDKVSAKLEKSLVILKNTSLDDLLGSMFLKNYGLRLGDLLSGKTVNEGWLNHEPYKNIIASELSNFGLDFQSRQSIGVVGKSSQSYEIILDPGSYVLLLRPLMGEKMKNWSFGKLKVSLDNQYFEVDAKSTNTRFKWFNLGNVTVGKGTVVSVENLEDGFSLIDGMVLVKEGVYQSERDKLTKLLSGAVVINDLESLRKLDFSNHLDSVPENISYRNINPSNYQLTVRPGNKTIIFKQNYSPYWKLGGVSGFPVDYFGNGFFVNEESELEQPLLYEPENIFHPLLLTAKIYFSLSLLILLLTFFPNKIYRFFNRLDSKK